jgi:hypothetical protein
LDSDESIYVGEFGKNNFNGQGTLTNTDGTVKSGVWRDNKYVDGKNDTQVSLTEEIKFYEGSTFRIDDSGLIIGNKISTGSSSNWFNCPGIISKELYNFAHAVLRQMSEDAGINITNKSYCAISQPNPGGTLSTLSIDVNFYNSQVNYTNCVIKNNCTSRRKFMAFPKNGTLYYNAMIQEGSVFKQACFSSSGEVVNLKGCYAL